MFSSNQFRFLASATCNLAFYTFIFAVPLRGLYKQLTIRLGTDTIDRYTNHNFYSAVFFRLIPFDVEKEIECTSPYLNILMLQTLSC
jgi:hypothetical protein